MITLATNLKCSVKHVVIESTGFADVRNIYYDASSMKKIRLSDCVSFESLSAFKRTISAVDFSGFFKTCVGFVFLFYDRLRVLVQLTLCLVEQNKDITYVTV